MNNFKKLRKKLHNQSISNGTLKKARKIRIKLLDIPICKKSYYVIGGTIRLDLEKSLRQKMAVVLLDSKLVFFMSSWTLFGRSLPILLPRNWRNYNELSKSNAINVLLWDVFVFWYSLKSIYRAVQIFLLAPIKSDAQKRYEKNFHGENIVVQGKKSQFQSRQNNARQDLNAWLILNGFNTYDIFYMNKKMQSDPNQISLISFNKISNKIRFIFTFITIAFYVSRRSLCGDITPLMLFADIVELEIYISSRNYEIYRNLLFNQSNWVCQPLWSIAASELGVKTTYYHYSLGLEPLISGDSNHAFTSPKIATWKNYWFIDEVQKEKFALNETDTYKITGIPWDSDSDEKLTFDRKYIALFDSFPNLNYFGCSPYFDAGIYNLDYYTSFMKQACAEINAQNLIIVYKPKRIVNSETKLYFDLIQSLKDLFGNDFVMVDSDTSIKRIVDGALGVVSQPFTTPAVLNYKKIPSVFFDPNGTLHNGYFSTRGIILTHNSGELRTWLKSIVC